MEQMTPAEYEALPKKKKRRIQYGARPATPKATAPARCTLSNGLPALVTVEVDAGDGCREIHAMPAGSPMIEYYELLNTIDGRLKQL